MHRCDLLVPRSAFTPREVARAGDLWRAFQDVAVGGSTAAGWPPSRYLEEGRSMIVRSMTVRHHRETYYREPLVGRTWPSRVRRRTFFRRECRLEGESGPIAAATQEWVHVMTTRRDDAVEGVGVAPAPDSLVGAFEPEEREPSVVLPGVATAIEGKERTVELRCWETWSDPLGHVNHPRYVDFCDEAVARAMRAVGLDPVQAVAVGESLTFRQGVLPGERVTVRTRLVGVTDEGAAVFQQLLEVAGEKVASAKLIRQLAHESTGIVRWPELMA